MAKFSPSQKQCRDSTATIENILDAAHHVLVTNGYAGFTIRLVAQTAGISPGNLTYYFPKKNVLLRAIISRLLEDYSRQLDTLFHSSDIPIEQEVENLVQWVLMDNVSEKTVRISREIWAMALHDDDIRNATDDFYDDLIERLVDMLRCSRPNVDKIVLREMVHCLLLFAEGTAVLFGTRRKRAVSVERMIELATQLLKSLETKQVTE